jgi:hypothetical protein
MELHTVVEGLPSGDTGDVVPVAVMTIAVGMVPNDVAGLIAPDAIVVGAGVMVAVVPGVDVETPPDTVDDAGTGIAVMDGDGRAGTGGGCGAGTVELGKSVMNDVAGCADSVSSGPVVLLVVDVLLAVDVEEVADTADVAGAAEIDGVVPVVPPMADMEVTGTVGVPGAICPVGVEQVTTVPGVVGSEASGTGASVVSGTPGWVAAENGLGPLSGDDSIVPGVDERPMAVVPMVETCAGLALQPNSRITVVNSKRRMAMASSAPL